MELIYKYSESAVKPTSVEKGKRTVFLRKNIIETERTDDEGNIFSIWTYEEAKLTPEEFDEYLKLVSVENAINSVNDSKNISQIVENGMTSDNNQLIIMEAIADLYDVIASITQGGTDDGGDIL